jgi:signal transduction histidine kinase
LQVQIEADRLLGDSDLLHSALTNLLDNAIKHADPGQDIVLSAEKQDKSVVLTVTDQGRGIPETELARILQPFYRVDKARSRRLGGAGLGLAICQLVAAAHGGELVIESKLGQGTRASLVLPGEAQHEG